MNVFLMITLFALAPVGWSQGPPPGVGSRLDWRIRTTILYLNDTEVEDGDGSYSVLKGGVDLTYDVVTIGYSRWNFEWQDVDKLPFGDGIHDPWQHFERISLSFRKFIRTRSPDYSYIVGGSISSLYEDDPGQSLGTTVYGGLVIGSPRASQFTVGAVYIYHPVHVTLWPMVGYNWQNESGWRIAIGFPRTAASFKRGAVTYSLGFLADRAMVGLSDDSTVAPDGYLEVSNIMVSGGIAYRPIPPFSISLKLARSINNDVTFYDSGEHEMEDYDVDRALGVQLGLDYRF